MIEKLDERTAADRYLKTRGLLIDGAWKPNGGGGRQKIVSPSTGNEIGSFPLADAGDIDAAVKAARKAFPEWKRMDPDKRQAILLRWADLIAQHQKDFTYIAALENGIPVIGGGGVGMATSWLRYYAGWCDKIEGSVVRPYPTKGIDYIQAVPYGVIAVITTWNMPLISTLMKVSPALAAGNCIVMKPTEFTVFSHQLICALAQEAGIPPGVFNLVPGGPEAGAALVGHADVDKITFTGGGHTAQKIMAAASANLTPVMFELGGKSANLVFADADLNAAAPFAVINSILALSGQGCVNPTRLIVQEAVYDEMVTRVGAVASSLKVGDPLDPSTMMGPVIHEAACQRIMGVINAGKTSGARLVCGGNRVGGALSRGAFIEPTVFADVDNGSELAQKEIFGPVLTVSKFSTEAEAIALANGTRYGLGAYFWTRDLARAHRVADVMDAGYVSVNGFAGMTPNAPFGGIRFSGFGSEGGRQGLEEFLRPKNIFIALPPEG